MTKTNGKWDENLPSFVRCFPFDDDDDDNIGGFLLVWQRRYKFVRCQRDTGSSSSK